MYMIVSQMNRFFSTGKNIFLQSISFIMWCYYNINVIIMFYKFFSIEKLSHDSKANKEDGIPWSLSYHKYNTKYFTLNLKFIPSPCLRQKRECYKWDLLCNCRGRLYLINHISGTQKSLCIGDYVQGTHSGVVSPHYFNRLYLNICSGESYIY